MLEKELLKPILTDDEIRLHIVELERENSELKKANDILKDALGFFAKDRKKKKHQNDICLYWSLRTSIL